MRQGQQHRRGRSRGSSGGNGSHTGGHSQHQRKGQNPLSRSFESNGPDVKVRGTAADVASKYMTLARDAQSSGDPVLAENYFQHAEHYNRMIITYREQQMQQSGGDTMNGNGRTRPFPGVDMGDLGEDADGEPLDPGMAEQPQMPGFARNAPQEGQPRGDTRQDNGRNDDRRQQHGRQSDPRSDGRQDRGERNDRGDRGENPRFRDRRFDRGERSDRPERNERPDRPAERSDRPADRSDRPERAVDRPERTTEDRPERTTDRPERAVERPERTDPRSEHNDAPQAAVVREAVPVDQPQPVVEAVDAPAPRERAAPRRRERYDMMKDQPEFLRRPVRRPRREEPAPSENSEPDAPADREEKPSA